LTAWDVSERNISMIGNAVPSFEKAHSGTSKPRQAYYRVTTSAEEQAGTYGLENVVAVLPGYATAPSPSIEEHLRRDGCSGLLEGRHSDGMYRLPGTYRHVVSLARNFRAAEGPLFYSEERREVMRGAEAAPAKSYSDTVEDMYSDGSLGSMVRGMRKSMARRGDSENQPEGEGEGAAAVEVLFSLCASSYATSFVASLLGSPLGQK
jgi:tRNA(Glu) U13 pseudouridine synthase TruD